MTVTTALSLTNAAVSIAGDTSQTLLCPCILQNSEMCPLEVVPCTCKVEHRCALNCRGTSDHGVVDEDPMMKRMEAADASLKAMFSQHQN